MGVSDIHDYYTATLLDRLRFWFIQPHLKPWCTLEQSAVQLGNLQSLLLENAISPNIKTGMDHPTISACILAWKCFLQHGNHSTKQMRVPINISTLRFINPNIATPRWEARGIKAVSAILMDGQLLPFEELASRFILPKGEFLTYVQLKSTLPHNLVTVIHISLEAWNFWTSPNPKKKGISLFQLHA